MSGPFVTTKYTSGSGSWSWPAGVEKSVEVWIWSGGAGGEADVPEDRGGAGGSGGGFTRVVVCKYDPEVDTVEYVVGAGGGPGDPGGDSYISQDSTELERVTGAAATYKDDDGGHAGAVGVGDFVGGVGASNYTQHTMFGDIPASPHGGPGGSSAGFASNGYAAEPTLAGTAPRLGGPGGLGGHAPDEDGGATNGQNAPGRGGGGGGGGAGMASGNGHAGEVWFIYPATTKVGSCCCKPCPPCVTKEDFGIPDTVNFSLGEIELDDSLPEDEETEEGCEGGARSYRRWTRGTPLSGFLSGAYEYAEPGSVSNGCCFRFSAVGSYSPSECGSGETDQRSGANPYGPQANGDSVESFTWTGSCGDIPDSWNYKHCDDTPVPAPGCADFCGSTYTVTNGEIFVPLPAYGTGDLIICIQGNTVTVSVSIAVTIPCRTYVAADLIYDTGTHGVAAGHGAPCAEDTFCETAGGCHHPDFTPCDGEGEAGCSSSLGGVGWTGTADISEVAGDTVWEKIQAASFTGSYSESSCSCAIGGCAGSYYNRTCACSCLLFTCFCNTHNPTDPENGSCIETTTTGQAIDVPCIYGSGTAAATLS